MQSVYTHFTGDKTEAQRGACLRSQQDYKQMNTTARKFSEPKARSFLITICPLHLQGKVLGRGKENGTRMTRMIRNNVAVGLYRQELSVVCSH